VERWARTIAAQYGYTDINHELELFGLCGDCASGKVASAG
jgi:Fur family ferric uptake transcriptional regulator